MIKETPTWSKSLVSNINGISDIVSALVVGFLWRPLDEGMIVRRSGLVASWYITITSVRWCFQASAESGYDPLTIASCIGILTPIAGIQAAAIKLYNDGRAKHGTDNVGVSS